MRVALTNPYCWPHVRRGSESAMHGLATWLQANGHEPIIVAGHSEKSQYEIDGIQYRTVRAPDWHHSRRELTPAVTMIPAMARELRRIKPDVVHAFSYHDALAAYLARKPFLISYAGIILKVSWEQAPKQYRMFKFASKRARLIFCPTRACGDALKHDYGFDYELLPYGINTSEFAVAEKTIPGRIMTAATANDRRKRPEFLVAAFALVAKENPDAHLVFAAAASDELQEILRGIAGTYADRITFMGDVSRDELKREYAKATVSTLVSLNEAFGLVQLESLAAGTPVVAARSGAVPEVLNDDVGGMFDPDDVDECAAQLQRFLTASARTASATAKKCVARAAQYDYEVIGPPTVALYERVRTRS